MTLRSSRLWTAACAGLSRCTWTAGPCRASRHRARPAQRGALVHSHVISLYLTLYDSLYTTRGVLLACCIESTPCMVVAKDEAVLRNAHALLNLAEVSQWPHGHGLSLLLESLRSMPCPTRRWQPPLVRIAAACTGGGALQGSFGRTRFHNKHLPKVFWREKTAVDGDRRPAPGAGDRRRRSSNDYAACPPPASASCVNPRRSAQLPRTHANTCAAGRSRPPTDVSGASQAGRPRRITPTSARGRTRTTQTV